MLPASRGKKKNLAFFYFGNAPHWNLVVWCPVKAKLYGKVYGIFFPSFCHMIVVLVPPLASLVLLSAVSQHFDMTCSDCSWTAPRRPNERTDRPPPARTPLPSADLQKTDCWRIFYELRCRRREADGSGVPSVQCPSLPTQLSALPLKNWASASCLFLQVWLSLAAIIYQLL